jgi:hypothetical protein
VTRNSVMAAAAVITLSTATAFAQSATPSLAQIARQTEQKRATSKPATKVYTNADLAPKVDEAAPAAPAGEVPAKDGYVSKSTGAVLSAEEMQAASQEKIKRETSKMDEKWWRSQAATLRQAIARAKEMISGYQASKPTTAAMRQRTEKALAESIEGLANLEKRWATFEESAHYAQVPKAWLEP